MGLSRWEEVGGVCVSIAGRWGNRMGYSKGMREIIGVYEGYRRGIVGVYEGYSRYVTRLNSYTVVVGLAKF